MLAGDKLGIGFGGRTLFSDLSFTVRPGDRVALAGPNGAGKSTLLKILTGNETADSGRVVQAKTVEVGYLPQEGVKHAGKTLYAEAETAFQAVLKLQDDCDALGEQLGELDTSSDEYAAVLEQFGDLQLRLENHDLARMRPKIETVLAGLGFKHSDLERDTGEFSGGWQMRIALSKLLLAEPDVLLLDEPTNHLDMDSVTWLEGYLKNYPGAIVLISHDRHLLDAITTRTLAFEGGRVESYSGNYSFYLSERIARREQLERSFRNQQKEIAKTEALIDRFRAKATKAKMVQSRIKQLDKMERIELEVDESEVSFRFPPAPASGQKVIEMEGLTKSYDGGEPVLKGLDFTLEKGERLAIVGVNGAGKSTFSRILAGVEPYDSGTCEVGFKVEIAYFSQDHAEDLDRTMTVYECAADAAMRGVAESEIRGVLGCFLFKADDVFKKVSVLSGGERSRLALARLLLSPSNFLILDEPTNHLDMASQAVLREALSGYTGSYAIVSHNRDFLDPIVEKVIEFIPNSKPRVYLGNVTDYVDKKKEEEKAKAAASQPAAAATTSSSKASGGNRKEQRKREAQLRQERQAKLKPLQTKLEEVEEKIAACEKAKADLVAEMGKPENASDGEKMKELGAKFQKANIELESSYSDWSEVSEELERVEAQLG